MIMTTISLGCALEAEAVAQNEDNASATTIEVRRERTTAMERGGNFIAKVVYTLDQPPRKRLILVAPSSFRARLSVYSAAVRGELRDPMIFTPLIKTLNAEITENRRGVR